MADLRFTSRFKQDYRRGMRRGCDVKKLKSLLALLLRGAPLPLDCRDAAVKGTNARVCRVEPGWLLVYQAEKGVVTLLRMKLIPGRRPKAAPPMGLWFRTLLRSPVKTALTVLLLAAASFLLLDNLSAYVMQTEAVRQAEKAAEGVLTVERSEVRNPQDGTRSWFLLTEMGERYRGDTYTYDTVHHQALSASDLEALEALPYVDAVDRRFMTAGVSEDYARLDGPSGDYDYVDRLVLEATVAEAGIFDYGSNIDAESARCLTLKDVTVLAGDRKKLDEQLEMLNGKAPGSLPKRGWRPCPPPVSPFISWGPSASCC